MTFMALNLVGDLGVKRILDSCNVKFFSLFFQQRDQLPDQLRIPNLSCSPDPTEPKAIVCSRKIPEEFPIKVKEAIEGR